VHHSSYENLGYEQNHELVTLCRDCHALFHENRWLVTDRKQKPSITKRVTDG
jgi:hypothetical protein